MAIFATHGASISPIGGIIVCESTTRIHEHQEPHTLTAIQMETMMTKTLSLIAALLVIAPIALATLYQAAAMVA
jgi:hypothetical protein